MMVGGDELAEGHSAVGLVAEEIHHLLSKLLGALNFLRCAVCCGISICLGSENNLSVHERLRTASAGPLFGTEMTVSMS